MNTAFSFPRSFEAVERKIVVDKLETQRDLNGCGQYQGLAWDLVSPRESLCCHVASTRDTGYYTHHWQVTHRATGTESLTRSEGSPDSDLRQPDPRLLKKNQS